MTVLTCAAVRRRLAAFHDEELPIPERIALQGHINGCVACAMRLEELAAVRDALRLAAAPAPKDDWTGLQPGVISRMRAEQYESWPARVARTFDDMHLVWIGLAATAGTFICAVLVLGILHFASPDRDDSLAAILAAMSAPAGSDLNPASLDSWTQVPSIPDDGVVSAALEQAGSQGEATVTYSAVIMRDGKISGLEVVDPSAQQRVVSQFMDGVSRGRLEPARVGQDPVAVNLVWLVEHMTVRGKGKVRS